MSAARIALVSDINGNAVALRALVADLERQSPDQVVCLGDVGQGGPQPVEVVEVVDTVLEVIAELRETGMPHADYFTWRWEPRG